MVHPNGVPEHGSSLGIIPAGHGKQWETWARATALARASGVVCSWSRGTSCCSIIVLHVTTRRHWTSQTVCFLEDKRSSNVCAWSAQRRRGLTSSKLFTPNIQPIVCAARPPKKTLLCAASPPKKTLLCAASPFVVPHSIAVPPRCRPRSLFPLAVELVFLIRSMFPPRHRPSTTGRVLKERFGMELSQKQMKNTYDNLKAKYIGLVYLRNKTGNLYNPQTNTFTLTNEEWEEFRKGHPKVVSLKTTPLPFLELCATLFDGNSATGNCKWTSTQTTSGVGSSSCHHVQPLLLTNSSFIDSKDDDGTSHEPPSEPAPNTSVDPPPESSPTFDRPSKRAKTSKSSSDKTIVTFDDIAVDMQKALQHIVKNKDGPTSVECYEKLTFVTWTQ
ncbi:hypothetical protein F3Y22_tig00110831pilonHSYRG00371 [Hibiscus syriacus]|uniref:Uncharacterized protein n=1 Tax=Hibiscus syriacus TaxID=106335 RepID=A0A6A2ZMX0_HIBSY|nr:hypothetical protein F3Y22_tig00110831pilonHSYRG00371 [Hibiscus syriacus]